MVERVAPPRAVGGVSEALGQRGAGRLMVSVEGVEAATLESIEL
jgi:hypothetical protein